MITDVLSMHYTGKQNHSRKRRNTEKQKTEKQQESKCVGCPYGKNSRYCFPCMRDLLGK